MTRTDRDDATHLPGIGCFNPHCVRVDHYPDNPMDMRDAQERLLTDDAPWGVWHIHRMATGRVEVRPRPISQEWTDAEKAVLDSLDQETTTRLKPILSFGPWWFAIELAQRVARIHATTDRRSRVYRPGWTNQGALEESR